MSATISKSLSWMLDPIVLCLALLILTTIFASQKRLTIYLLLIIVFLGAISISPLPEVLMANLELPQSNDETQYREYAVVLGGDNIHFIKDKNKFDYAESFDRVGEALHLYRQKKISKIILTGGDVEYAGQIVNESKASAAWLVAMGVPEGDILTEEKSRSTYENASFVKEIIDSRKITEFYLITSASHMRRALGVFRKLGMNPTPYSVDYRAPAGNGKIFWNAMGLGKLSILKAAIYEYAGIAYYTTLGYL
ncbi:MAG: hypothetical protein A4S09_02600 [Proteobacteria bacterium SG_bin7]|nr:MAG: hypothetical protein A4S09_02600 [Proteobacteria bacterium SG_bin7]